ncbi:TenA family protein [Paenirhodobacter sp.]|uniref:TenA family protein n=1 Tax=Paenirhodobacter sp. TaxID=1965326 RepID=UPI003B4090DB
MMYGATFPLLRAAAPDWHAFTHHPFVEGLKDGSLPRAAFLHYLQQDYVFLIHFSRAWALAVTKAETVAEMRACAATVHALLVEEMRLHEGICAEAGIDLTGVEERIENLAYTRYVLDSGDLLDLLAGLMPCVLGYGEIGARMLREAGETPYRDWIETYGGAEFQQTCAEAGALLDAATARRIGPPGTGPRWPALCHRFATATRLEVGFWDMGLRP